MTNRPETSDYTVTLISDTHFDEGPWEHYRPGIAADPTSLPYRNFQRNIRMWENLIPRMLTAAAASAQDSDFVMHMGDVAQGDAANAETLTEMLEKGHRRVTAAFGTKPVYLLVGNHDVRAPGGVEAYQAWSRRPLNRCFRKGPDAWILVDTDRPPDLQGLKDLFRQADGARWTFFLSHRPVLPCNAGSVYSFLYDGAPQTECRHELRRQLAVRRAIVLAAHVHGLYETAFDFPEGRVTQFVINSLWEKPELAELSFRSVSANKWCTKSGGIPENLRPTYENLAAEYRPFLAGHRQVHAAGHFRLRVGDERVTLEIFGGDADRPGATATLADRNQKSVCRTKARILRKIADFLRFGLTSPRNTTSR